MVEEFHIRGNQFIDGCVGLLIIQVNEGGEIESASITKEFYHHCRVHVYHGNDQSACL